MAVWELGSRPGVGVKWKRGLGLAWGVLGEDVGDDGLDFFGAGYVDEAGYQFAAEAGALVTVGK
jgi:hypothetical protein